MTMEWTSVLTQIEDSLFPKLGLSVWERAVYYHLLRQTWVLGQATTQCSVQAVATGAGMSDWKAREAIRSLHQKGCIKIEDRSRSGHEIRVLLPSDLNLPQQVDEPPPDLESIDFFVGRQYVDALLARENARCFYCLRQVTRDTCELDHANPLADGADNSYRNIVVSCHECNKLKQDMKAEEHLRRVFRRNLLSDAELQERMAALDALRKGDVVPEL
jgi:hypothetical protein